MVVISPKKKEMVVYGREIAGDGHLSLARVVFRSSRVELSRWRGVVVISYSRGAQSRVSDGRRVII